MMQLSASSSVRTVVLDFSRHKGRGREREMDDDSQFPAFAQNPSPLLYILAVSEGMEVQASSSGGAAGSRRIRQGN